ncbi:dual specificity protein kinase yak1 [Apophysomyces sp. BC1034]|nr:dual specificity protein kinase yak1 [Apophysomyces sp. BC1015]KAG0177534.1 dual specificity protein kinase yak1 [Apophysomyces sp. BC1021]KAG0187785.1 dual specificity protein kinase yak1 [Apophysomyces sp. BC1034]
MCNDNGAQRRLSINMIKHAELAKPNGEDSPFYSTVIEPQRQPPPSKVTRAFRKVMVGERSTHHAKKPVSRSLSVVYAMTAKLTETYKRTDPQFQYSTRTNPRRALTKPSKPAKNDGFDNEDHDYILRVNDILGEEDHRHVNFNIYRVIDLLGQGTFGQVVKCERISTGELFSIKVIKNKPAYRTQSRMEVEILKKLNHTSDPDDRHHILRLFHTFDHKNHLCLVFELLSVNLYELLKQNNFKGLSADLVRVITTQLLDTLVVLKEAKIIHCDLKPENILLTSVDSPTIKVVDFGSACHEANRMYTYIQSRFYRSPEVLLNMKYTAAIDMWSLGCIVAELYLGLPLFPGRSEYNQLRRIVDMLGVPPTDILEKGKNTPRFFHRVTEHGKPEYKLKSREQFGQEQQRPEPRGKKYFAHTTLDDIILHYANGSTAARNEQETQRDLQTRHALVDFLKGLLHLNPLRRWTPQQARNHPFIVGNGFSGSLDPSGRMKADKAPPQPDNPHAEPARPLKPTTVMSDHQTSRTPPPSCADEQQKPPPGLVSDPCPQLIQTIQQKEEKRTWQRIGRAPSPHPLRLKHRRTRSQANILGNPLPDTTSTIPTYEASEPPNECQKEHKHNSK